MLDGKKIGFIGGGNMAEAVIRGLLSGGVAADSIMVSEPLMPRRKFIAVEFSADVTDDNLDLARRADIIILAVKPQVAASVLTALEPAISERVLVVSIMAGITTHFIEESLAPGIRVIRAMPNTPALVQSGATAICAGRKADGDDIETARGIFGHAGIVVTVPETQMDAVTALSGSGPAYVCSFIESLADGGVRHGLSREVALQLAAHTVLGTARMIIESGDHPAILREKVTSPGGTTIAGLHALERGGFRGMVMDGVEAAYKRSRELSGS